MEILKYFKVPFLKYFMKFLIFTIKTLKTFKNMIKVGLLTFNRRMKNIKRLSVLPEKNIVKFLKYLRNIS